MENNIEKTVRMNYFVENHKQAIGKEPHTTMYETEIVPEGYTLHEFICDGYWSCDYHINYTDTETGEWIEYAEVEIVEVADGVYDVIDPENDNYIVEKYILKDYEEIEEA